MGNGARSFRAPPLVWSEPRETTGADLVWGGCLAAACGELHAYDIVVSVRRSCRNGLFSMQKGMHASPKLVIKSVNGFKTLDEALAAAEQWWRRYAPRVARFSAERALARMP